MSTNTRLNLGKYWLKYISVNVVLILFLKISQYCMKNTYILFFIQYCMKNYEFKQ
jgi:hypothetical protein